MTLELQKTGYRDSRYERPNQKWVCGWTEEGDPCPMGPDRRGRCTAHVQSQCTPRREGDRYLCSRPAVFGGPCARGPLPDGACSKPEPTHALCEPRLSHRARRGRFVIACTTLALGILILFVTGPWDMSFISPGELSSAHGAIAHADGSEATCAACHAAATGGARTWIRMAFGGWKGAGESERCLECHFEGQVGDRARALLVHSVDRAALAERTAALEDVDHSSRTALQALASLAGPPPRSPAGEIPCATCHSEHRGREVDLTRMDDTRCQVCHRLQFASFSDGHPEFNATRGRDTAIRFDHARHEQTHFGDAEFDCARCHQADAGGGEMLLRPYFDTCSGCHYQGKPDHHGGRIKANDRVLFQLPFIELGDPTVYWPEEAALGEEIAPMIRLLLAGDERALEAMRSLVEQETDWIPEYWEPDSDELKTDLASAILRVFLDLVAGDEAALGQRLARGLGADPEGAEVRTLVEQLVAGRFAILTFQRRWLSGLGDEPGEGAIARPGSTADPDWTPPPGTTGWYVDPDAVSVAYRPTGHADPLLKGWIDALVAHTGSSDDEVAIDAHAPDGGDALGGAWRTEFFEELTSKDHGGFLYSACLRCHVVGTRDGKRLVHWSSPVHAENGTGYARFTHRSHVSLLERAASCGVCHRVAEDGEGTEEATKHGLAPQRRSQCTGCHAPGGADEACLTCHVYHFARLGLPP